MTSNDSLSSPFSSSFSSSSSSSSSSCQSWKSVIFAVTRNGEKTPEGISTTLTRFAMEHLELERSFALLQRRHSLQRSRRERENDSEGNEWEGVEEGARDDKQASGCNTKSVEDNEVDRTAVLLEHITSLEDEVADLQEALIQQSTKEPHDLDPDPSYEKQRSRSGDRPASPAGATFDIQTVTTSNDNDADDINYNHDDYEEDDDEDEQRQNPTDYNVAVTSSFFLSAATNISPITTPSRSGFEGNGARKSPVTSSPPAKLRRNSRLDAMTSSIGRDAGGTEQPGSFLRSELDAAAALTRPRGRESSDDAAVPGKVRPESETLTNGWSGGRAVASNGRDTPTSYDVTTTGHVRSRRHDSPSDAGRQPRLPERREGASSRASPSPSPSSSSAFDRLCWAERELDRLRTRLSASDAEKLTLNAQLRVARQQLDIQRELRLSDTVSSRTPGEADYGESYWRRQLDSDEEQLKIRIAELESNDVQLKANLEEFVRKENERKHQLLVRISELEDSRKDLRQEVIEVHEQLDRETTRREELTKTVSDLTTNETRLIEHLREKDKRVMTLTAENEELSREMEMMSTRLANIDEHERSHARELQDVLERSDELRSLDAQSTFADLEAEQRKLTETIDEVVARNQALERLLEDRQLMEKRESARFQDQLDAKHRECARLQEQLDVLMTSEEELMDKLTEQDKLIKKLQRDGADAQTHAETAQRELSALRIDAEQRAKRQDDEIARLSRELDTARDVELKLRRHVTDADQSEAALRKRLAAEEAAEGYRGRLEGELRERVRELQAAGERQRETIGTLEAAAAASRVRLAAVEEENEKLKESVAIARALSTESLLDFSVKSDDYEGGRPSGQSQRSFPSAGLGLYHTFPSGSLYNLEGMTKVEMLSRIYQLERKDAFQTSRIQALTESLGSLRETVEGATTVMVSDAVIPVKNRYDLMSIDTRYPAPLWSPSDAMMWKMKIFDMSREQSYLKAELREAMLAYREQEMEYRSEIEALEDELAIAHDHEEKLRVKYNQLLAVDSVANSSVDGAAPSASSQGNVRASASGYNLGQHHVGPNVLAGSLHRDSPDSASGRPDRSAAGPSSTMTSPRAQTLTSSMSYRGSSAVRDSAQTSPVSGITGSSRLGARLFGSGRGLTGWTPPSLSPPSNQLFLSSFGGGVKDLRMVLRMKEMEQTELVLKNKVKKLAQECDSLEVTGREDRQLIQTLSASKLKLEQSESKLKERVMNVEEQELRLIRQLQEITNKLAEAEDRIKRDAANELSLRRGIQEHKNTHEKLKENLDAVSRSLEDKKIRLSDKEEELQNIRERLHATDQLLEEKNTRLMEKTKDLALLKDQLESTERSLHESNIRLEDKTKEITVLQDQLLALERSVDEKTTRLAEKTKDVINLQDRLEESVRSHENTDMRLVEKIRELANVREQFEHAKKSLEEKLAEKESRLSNKSKEVAEISTRFDALQDLFERLQFSEKALHGELEVQRAEKNALEERLEAGQNTLKSRENELARVREELMVTKERLEEMEDGFKRLKASEHSLREQVRTFQQDTEKYTETLNSALEAQRLKDSELKRLETEQRLTDEQLDESTSLVHTLRASETLLQQQVRAYQAGEVEWKRKLDEAHETMRRKDVEQRELKEELMTEKTTLTKTTVMLRAQLSAAEDAQLRLKQQIGHLEEREQALKMRLENYVKSLGDAQRMEGELKRRTDDTSDRLHQLEDVESRLLFEVSVLRREKESLEQTNERLRDDKRALEDRLASSLGKMAALEDRATEAEEEREKSERAWKERVETVEQRERKTRRRNAELELSIESQRTRKVDDLRQNSKAVQARMMTLETLAQSRLTSDLKKAIDLLSRRHPTAHADFISSFRSPTLARWRSDNGSIWGLLPESAVDDDAVSYTEEPQQSRQQGRRPQPAQLVGLLDDGCFTLVTSDDGDDIEIDVAETVQRKTGDGGAWSTRTRTRLRDQSQSPHAQSTEEGEADDGRMSDSTEDGIGENEKRGGRGGRGGGGRGGGGEGGGGGGRRGGGGGGERFNRGGGTEAESWPPIGLRVLWPTTTAPWTESSSIQIRPATTTEDDSGPDDIDDDVPDQTSTQAKLTASSGLATSSLSPSATTTTTSTTTATTSFDIRQQNYVRSRPLSIGIPPGAKWSNTPSIGSRNSSALSPQKSQTDPTTEPATGDILFAKNPKLEQQQQRQQQQLQQQQKQWQQQQRQQQVLLSPRLRSTDFSVNSPQRQSKDSEVGAETGAGGAGGALSHPVFGTSFDGSLGGPAIDARPRREDDDDIVQMNIVKDRIAAFEKQSKESKKFSESSC